jgi:Carboxypeptidase regulatory-like domain/TonB dependent receptor
MNHSLSVRVSSRLLLAIGLAILLGSSLAAQSTFGTILGTVRDSSGAVIPNAQLTLLNTGTQGARSAVSESNGDYAFRNIDVGAYQLTIAATGFQTLTMPPVTLTARETRRVDAVLKLSGETQTVVVIDDSAAPVISTEVSNVAETKVGDELVELPVAIYSRSTGSTSPISTLTTEAGVQTDDSGNLAVLGTTAALLSVTIDGISSVGVEYSGPVNEMFPSFNSIEEIRVSESNNNAEFSGVADITTVSKAGTVHYHGGLFENHENTAFNSGNPFAASKPKIIMNDFGGTLGGPLRIPHFSSGQPSTFFFASYEGLRLPRETPIVLSVPSASMRSGNLTDYLAGQGVDAIYQPDGTPLDPANVPVSPISANVLKYLFPEPNFGDPASYANNYQINFPAPISANQGDIRLDRNLTAKQTAFARFSYKNRQVLTAPSAACTFTYCAEAGSPLQGPYNTPEIDEGLTFAHNYVFTPAMLNEFRGGFNEQHTSEEQSYSTTDLLSQTGFTVPQPDTQYSEAPQVLINGFMSTGAGNPGVQRGQIIQLLDNLTWTRHAHTFKFGGDFKRLTDHDDNVFGNYRSGWYVFDSSSDVVSAVGDPYAAFLLGYPDYTSFSTTNNPTMDGVGHSYAFYAQDDWKILSNLTLNLGLRYEVHPPLRESHSNTAAFLPDFSGTGTDGTTVNGAVVVSDNKGLALVSQDFADSIAPTPILTAAQAHIPSALRFTDHSGIGPRIGFAWRPYGKDTTVIRGGWGRFIESPLGFSLVSGWAVASSNVSTYSQDYQDDGVTPILSLASPLYPQAAGSAYGTAGFYYAFPIHYKDPTVQQWNLTFEQDFGRAIGMRLSYTGSHGKNLDAMVDLNQVHANTVGYADASADLPYPAWSIIQSVSNLAESNYNSGTAEISRHSGKGITFDASYTWTRDLSNAGGATPNAFAVAGGTYLTDRFHPGLDYGNVIYDRKHRFLATGLYDLPFGRGRTWLSSGDALNRLVGDWQLAGVAVLQSGPFLTPFEASTDPAGTNILTTIGQTRSDLAPHGIIYPDHRTTTEWLASPSDPHSAFSIPADNRGYFGTAGVGSIVGPGTANFSLSLSKGIALTEKSKIQLSVEAANVFNHRNYEPPDTQLDSGGFGSISALQTAEGAGPRSLELAGRITF